MIYQAHCPKSWAVAQPITPSVNLRLQISNLKTQFTFEVVAAIAKKSHTNINEPNCCSMDTSSLEQPEERKTLLFMQKQTKTHQKKNINLLNKPWEPKQYTVATAKERSQLFLHCYFEITKFTKVAPIVPRVPWTQFPLTVKSYYLIISKPGNWHWQSTFN